MQSAPGCWVALFELALRVAVASLDDRIDRAPIENPEAGDRRVETNIGFGFGGFDDADAADGRGTVKNLENVGNIQSLGKRIEPLPKQLPARDCVAFRQLALELQLFADIDREHRPLAEFLHDGDGQVI